jgi:ComF family protein
MSLAADFVSLFFPRYCRACFGSLVKGEEIFCTRCIAEFPKTNYHLQAANPVEARLAGRLPVKHAWAFLKFRKGGIVQHLLHQLKYKNHPEVGVALGKIFGHELRKAGLASDFDIIIPVPLHELRKRKRGYNQSAKLAEGLSFAMETPWDETVSIRKMKTNTQTKKTKMERWENVRNVLSLSENKSLAGKRILLVDDIITTGSTLEACGQHLISAGCQELSVACIAEAQ